MAHLMQCFGLLQILHADLEAVRVADGRPLYLRVVFLYDIHSCELILSSREKETMSWAKSVLRNLNNLKKYPIHLHLVKDPVQSCCENGRYCSAG